MTGVDQEERARRLQAAIREKEAELARRRGANAAAPSVELVQNFAAASLAAAAAAWMTGFPAKIIVALGPVGDALAALSGLRPVFLGIAVGCLLASFRHVRARRAAPAVAPTPQPATLMLWLSLLFLVLNLLPAAL
jgi:hypothetical protein